MRACSGYSVETDVSYFEGFDLAEFWKDSEYARRNYTLPPPDANSVAAVEKKLGYKLPRSYIELMQAQNGGLPKRTCFPTSEPTSWSEDHVAIHGIHGIGDAASYSLCGSMGNKFRIEEWGYPPIGIYFGDCPSAGHDMICLDYRECGPSGKPTVVHVDQEFDYRITFLTESFEDFIRGLVDEEEFAEEVDQASEFVWRTEIITATIKHDDEFLKFGQYLHLEQDLPEGEAGWLDMKLNVPDSWHVRDIVVSDGVVRVYTKDSGTFELTRDNFTVLSHVLLSRGESKPDYQLQIEWLKHAGIEQG